MAGGLVGRGGGRGKRRGAYRPNSEINVTPLVDVMLVLLIVFMVAAPMMTVGVEVNLPKSSASPLSQQNDPPLYVTVKADGSIFVMETATPFEAVPERVKAIIATGNPDRAVYVRGDRDTSYGDIMRVMGHLSAGGLTKVSLVAQPQD